MSGEGASFAVAARARGRASPAGLTGAVVEAVERARTGALAAASVHRSLVAAHSTNQYCLFLKPGVSHPGADITAVLALVLERARAFDLEIADVLVLSGRLLARRQVMTHHYGALNRVARDAVSSMTPAMAVRLRDALGPAAARGAVLGGFEALGRFPGLSAPALESLWERLEHHRVGSAAFCAMARIDGESFVLVNGFVPNLMRRYARAHSTLIVFCLHGDLPWADTRGRFLGAPDPAAASPGSLRNEFFINRQVLGLKDFGLGWNGAHLSAGPLEACIELSRFSSLVSRDGACAPTDFQFGRRLVRALPAPDVQAVLGNPTIETAGGRLTLAALTEQLDEDVAMGVLLRHRREIRAAAIAAVARPAVPRARAENRQQQGDTTWLHQ